MNGDGYLIAIGLESFLSSVNSKRARRVGVLGEVVLINI